jgi:hypothetical protein
MKFANARAQEMFPEMLSETRDLAIEMDKWAQEKFGIELVLTATRTTREEDNGLQRVSSTHRDGRAFDVRITDPHSGERLLSEDFIAQFCAYFRKKYPNLGAVSGARPEGRNRNLIVYKPHGSGPHLHIQIKRN